MSKLTLNSTESDLIHKRQPATGGMWGGRMLFFLTRAFINIRQHAFVNVVTMGTIALAMFIASLFLLVFVNLESAMDNWSERVQITVYFDRELAPPEQSQLQQRITAIAGVSRATYVSRAEALVRFKSRLKGQGTLLEGVRADVLPTSFEINLKQQYRETGSVEAVVTRLKAIPGITEVQFGEEWVKRFNLFLDFMRFLGSLLGAFLIIAVIFIVSNTIKLTIYSRRDELDVMALVGATRFFIKAPFLLEGIIQGVVGTGSALLLLFGLYEGFMYNAGDYIPFNPLSSGLMFIPYEYCAALLGAGALLGFIGSLTSLKRFITT